MVFSTKNLRNPRKSSMNGGFHRGNQGIIPSEAAAPRSKPPSRASFPTADRDDRDYFPRFMKPKSISLRLR